MSLEGNAQSTYNGACMTLCMCIMFANVKNATTYRVYIVYMMTFAKINNMLAHQFHYMRPQFERMMPKIRCF